MAGGFICDWRWSPALNAPQKADATSADSGWYRLNTGALHGFIASHHSHTTPSPSPSRMYRYAGCPRRTGAIPCRLASLHVIRPLPLSS